MVKKYFLIKYCQPVSPATMFTSRNEVKEIFDVLRSFGFVIMGGAGRRDTWRVYKNTEATHEDEIAHFYLSAPDEIVRKIKLTAET